MDPNSEVVRLYSFITARVKRAKQRADDVRDTTINVTNRLHEWLVEEKSEIKIALDIWISSRYEEWDIELAMPDGSRMTISSRGHP